MKSGMLDVGDGHTLYYEEHGAADGQPAVVLHGGPGGGLQRSVLEHFDLRRWRVFLYDQRGCGRSTPYLETRANTTAHLVADIERLRAHVGVERWVVFGGSWGSTLALAYAATPAGRRAISGLILRGICLMAPWEQRWLYEEGGASRIHPEAWAAFVRPVRRVRGKNKTHAYRTLLRNRRTRRAAARAWWNWESALSTLRPRRDTTTEATVVSLAVLENHYFHHNAWITAEYLLRGARRLSKRIPVTIIQGRYDLVCPPAAAVALASAVPHAKLVMVPDAGHSATEPGIAHALTAAVRAFSNISRVSSK